MRTFTGFHRDMAARFGQFQIRQSIRDSTFCVGEAGYVRRERWSSYRSMGCHGGWLRGYVSIIALESRKEAATERLSATLVYRLTISRLDCWVYSLFQLSPRPPSFLFPGKLLRSSLISLSLDPKVCEILTPRRSKGKS